ncbi:MAG: hypothetical protein AB1730_10150 [Myxococcota bacterium]|jgi:hypothetical protein
MPRFPRRTLVLMVLALVAFLWMWAQTHRAPRPAAPAGSEPPALRATPVELVPAGGDS